MSQNIYNNFPSPASVLVVGAIFIYAWPPNKPDTPPRSRKCKQKPQNWVLKSLD